MNLYDPAAKRWSLYAASGDIGAVSAAAVGSFKNGRGEFLGQEYLPDAWVLAGDVFSDITATKFRWERSISLDDGRIWKLSWVRTFTRETSL